jgi:hypothetical protein
MPFFLTHPSLLPNIRYFVTMLAGSGAMLHLFRAKSRKDGLAFTFTVAQAFSVRWNMMKDELAGGPTSPRRATSPTGALETTTSSPACRRGILRKQPQCTLGDYKVRLKSEESDETSEEDGGDDDDHEDAEAALKAELGKKYRDTKQKSPKRGSLMGSLRKNKNKNSSASEESPKKKKSENEEGDEFSEEEEDDEADAGLQARGTKQKSARRASLLGSLRMKKVEESPKKKKSESEEGDEFSEEEEDDTELGLKVHDIKQKSTRRASLLGSLKKKKGEDSPKKKKSESEDSPKKKKGEKCDSPRRASLMGSLRKKKGDKGEESPKKSPKKKGDKSKRVIVGGDPSLRLDSDWLEDDVDSDEVDHVSAYMTVVANDDVPSPVKKNGKEASSVSPSVSPSTPVNDWVHESSSLIDRPDSSIDL